MPPSPNPNPSGLLGPTESPLNSLELLPSFPHRRQSHLLDPPRSLLSPSLSHSQRAARSPSPSARASFLLDPARRRRPAVVVVLPLCCTPPPWPPRPPLRQPSELRAAELAEEWSSPTDACCSMRSSALARNAYKLPRLIGSSRAVMEATIRSNSDPRPASM